jgi:2-octaprenyl-6-methoxyphenol hydroxylase
MANQFDIAIVGGGLTGVASARLLAERGFSILHFAPTFERDHRTSALMMPTVEFMRAQGLIKDPASIGTALENIRIVDATSRILRAPETLFQSCELDLPAFAYNFANAGLLAAFSDHTHQVKLVDARVERIAKTDAGFEVVDANGNVYSATSLVAADGKKSAIRAQFGFKTKQQRHAQSALVADLEFERPEANTSVEFHYENGPFTLVPAGGKKVNLVWLDQHDVLNDVATKDQAALEAAVFEKSHRLFGHAKALTNAFVFPLSNLSVEHAGRDGVFLIGEAAHAFPPIGAQGLNLGLRDVEDMLIAFSDLAPGFATHDAERASGRYDQLRGRDLKRTNSFVDGLYRSLVSDLLPAQALRHYGLWAIKTVPPLRKFAMRFGLGK